MKKVILLILMSGYLLYATAQERVIQVKYKRNSDKSITFTYEKTVPASYLLEVMVDDLENAYFSGFSRVVKLYTGTLFTLKPTDPEKHINFKYSVAYRKGDPSPKIKEDIIYLFPFDTSRAVKIASLSNLNEKYFNSSNTSNWAAYQFTPDKEDTVYCSRKGIVTEIIDEYLPDATGMLQFHERANRIEIEHPDGTFAVYSVLKKGSIQVEVGDWVYPGTPLAVAGKLNAEEPSELRFTIYYVIGETYKDPKERKLFNDREKTGSNITPVFATNRGKRALQSGVTYHAVFDNELIEQELTRREKKKLLKE